MMFDRKIIGALEDMSLKARKLTHPEWCCLLLATFSCCEFKLPFIPCFEIK
jgi:hypothetical protein